ncbi:UDP-glucuronosyltransferase 1A7-like isoform X2 [Procambarus clarkii]|uniref:UDP-glucuronosyltransferase 1A7-like isoform X2 n=1 Tax=Procambarus clarkii TaxID=6728 RepID=UPI00374469C1
MRGGLSECVVRLAAAMLLLLQARAEVTSDSLHKTSERVSQIPSESNSSSPEGPDIVSRSPGTIPKVPEDSKTDDNDPGGPEAAFRDSAVASSHPESGEQDASVLDHPGTLSGHSDDVPDGEGSPAGDGEGPGVVVVALGGGEDLVVIAQIASVLHRHGHRVTAVLYGPAGPRDEVFPSGVKVLEVGVAADDPLHPGGETEGVTPGEEEGVEWVSGRVVSSRVWACRQFSSQTWVEEVVSRASLVVTPLFLHDLCVLTLAQRVGVTAVGVVTSRLGAWWVWEHLGVLPNLATTPVPPHNLLHTSIWARTANLARHYGYLSALRQQWQAPAATSLPSGWTPGTMDTLYGSLAGVLVAWDTLVDTRAPYTPTVVHIGGFAFQTGHMTKDLLVPALLNRAGVVTVCPGGGEAWVGSHALHALHAALALSSYTVLWRAPYPHLRPQVSQQESNPGGARFIYKEVLPLSDVMRLAVVVPAADVTVPALREAMITLAGDRSFRERGRELAEDLHDRPLAPPDRLLVTLERIMRRTHARRLVKKDNGGLYLLQQANADVYLLLLLLLTCFMALLIVLVINILPIVINKRKVKAD